MHSAVHGFFPISKGLVFNTGPNSASFCDDTAMIFASGDTLSTRLVPTKFGSIGFIKPLDVSGQLFFLQLGSNESSTLYVWNYTGNKAPRRV